MPPLLMSLRMPCRKARLSPPMNGVPPREGQAVGDERVQHGDEAGDGEARHHGVADVLLAHHAAVEQAEARDRHHQHERHRGQHPGGVAAARRAVGEHRRDSRHGGVLVGFRRWRRRRAAQAGVAGGAGFAAAAGRCGAGGGAAAGAVRGGRGVCACVCDGRRRDADQGGNRQRRREAGNDSLDRFIVRELRSGRDEAQRSERVFVLFAGADAHRRVEVVDEDLAVADLAGARSGDDRLDHLVGQRRS